MLSIEFTEPKSITLVEASVITVSSCQVEQVTDNAINKTVIAVIIINGTFKTLTLWESDAYDTVGQWTDDDVIARVTELL